MSFEEQFSAWVEQEKEAEVLAYLQEAGTKERKNLVPIIKKLNKYYSEWITTNNSTYKSRGNQQQQDILTLAAFVCYSRADFEKYNFASWVLDPAQLAKVKSWYMPDWFSDFVNKLGEGQFYSNWVKYDNIMQLADEGYLQPSRRLICLILPAYIFEHHKNDKQWYWVFKPEKLLQRPVTLQEHIWYLFEEESHIHYSERYLNFQDTVDKEKTGWIEAFVLLEKEGKADRQRLLKESLLAANRNFNKVLSSWFMELVAALQPAEEELLQLQAELFSLLSSPHSKPVNETLGYIKKIVGLAEFDMAAFIDALPAVLNSKIKTTVSGGLTLLEQVGKKEKAWHAAIVQLATQALVHTDEALQTKAAKLMAKLAEKNDPQLIAALSPYQDSLLQNTKAILSSWMEETLPEVNEQDTMVDSGDELLPLQPIAVIDNTDELVFMASQAFDNNVAWHIDVLPAALVQLQSALESNMVLGQLQPALQRALKLIKSGLRSTQGQYDHMLAVFFIDVCVHLVRQYPSAAKALNKVFDDHDQKKEGANMAKWMNKEEGTYYLSDWENYSKDPFYEPYRLFLLDALQKIIQGDSLPLLSTPTHEPAWVDAAILIERVAAYQQAGAQPGRVDLQMAIARCHWQEKEELMNLATQQLRDEWQSLFLFLLDDTAAPQTPFQQPAAWMMASLRRQPFQAIAALDVLGYNTSHGFAHYSGQYSWIAMTEEFYYDRYQWTDGKPLTVKEKGFRKMLRMHVTKGIVPNRKITTEKTMVKGLLQKLGLQKPKATTIATVPPLLYDYLVIKSNYFSNEHNDIRRALLMTPGNTEAFLAELIKRCLQYPSAISEMDKKTVIAALQVLHEVWDQQAETAHVFLAAAMLMPDKTAAALAAGIWLQYAPSQKVNTALTGKIIGTLCAEGYAPLKRFTDLVMQSLYKVSAQHTVLLVELISALLLQLPDEPLTNLKKLLEIYTETLFLTQSKLTNEALLQRLEVWKANAGLKKLIMGITA